MKKAFKFFTKGIDSFDASCQYRQWGVLVSLMGWLLLLCETTETATNSQLATLYGAALGLVITGWVINRWPTPRQAWEYRQSLKAYAINPNRNWGG